MFTPGAKEKMEQMAGSKGTVHLYKDFADLARHFDVLLEGVCGKWTLWYPAAVARKLFLGLNS